MSQQRKHHGTRRNSHRSTADSRLARAAASVRFHVLCVTEPLEGRRLLTGVSVTGVSDLVDGDTSAIAALLVNPGIDGKVSLREALAAANNTAGADSVTFDPVTFASTQTITLGGTQLEISDDVDLAATAAGVTISANGLSRVFSIYPGVSASLSGLTMTAGDSGAGSGLYNGSGTVSLTDCRVVGNGGGSGIYNQAGRLTLSDCIVSNNTGRGIVSTGEGELNLLNCDVSWNSTRAIENNLGIVNIASSTISHNLATGGAAAIWNYDGRLTLNDSIISDNDGGYGPAGAIDNEAGGTLVMSRCVVANNSSSYGGGGLWNAGEGTSADISDCTFSGNSAQLWGGGAILHQAKATLTLARCTFDANHAYAGSSGGGGAIACGGGGGVAPGPVIATDCVFSNNTSLSNGGGLFFYFAESLSMTRCTITGNSSTFGYGSGGGLLNWGTPTTLVDCAITGNTSVPGGGGGIQNAYSRLTLTNCTVSGNSAGAYGSAGGVSVGDTNLQMNNCTVTSNAGVGVAIYQSYDLAVFSNTIIAGNSGVDVNRINGGTLTASYCLIGTTGGTPVIGLHNQLGVDPLLGPLADNGGLTQTHALLPGSPALDAGSNALVPAGVLYDQRGEGHPRIYGSAVDIGAYEYSPDQVTPVAAITSAPDKVYDAAPYELAVGTITGVGGVALPVTYRYYDSGHTLLASAPVNAGSYFVTAYYAGDSDYTEVESTPAPFTIQQASPTFGQMVVPTIIAGVPSVVVSGKLTAGTLIPPGTVSITLNGVTTPAAIGVDGSFSATLATGSLAAGNYAVGFTCAGTANFNTATASGTLLVKTPTQAIQDLQAQVAALHANGTLNQGNANALTVKLDAAISSQAKKNKTAATNQLDAFVNQVTAFVQTGKLSQAVGHSLIEQVDLIISVL